MFEKGIRIVPCVTEVSEGRGINNVAAMMRAANISCDKYLRPSSGVPVEAVRPDTERRVV